MMLLARAITHRYSTPTNNRLRSSSNTRNQAVVQADKVNIQSRNVRNDGIIARRSYNVQEETVEGSNVKKKLRMYKEIFELLPLEMLQMFSVINATRKVTMLVTVQAKNDDHEQTYLKQPKIINSTIGDDQFNSNIIFDDPNVKVNNGSVDHDKNVHDSYELEQLARNAYKEAEKQQTQGEIDEFIKHVNQKTYAYADVCEHNQDLLITISELKVKLKNVEKGLKDATSVIRPMSRGSSSMNSVLSNTSHSADAEVPIMTNKKTNVASKKNVVQNKRIVTNVDVKNASKAKDLNMHSNVRRALFTTPKTAKPKSLDTTPVSAKTRKVNMRKLKEIEVIREKGVLA
ncbi:hypothetical protein Tco_1346472 [Tanacetum coccineum]